MTNDRLQPTLEHTYADKTDYPNPTPKPSEGISYEPITDYSDGRPQDEDHAAAAKKAIEDAQAAAMATNIHALAEAAKRADEAIGKRLLDETDTDAAVQD